MLSNKNVLPNDLDGFEKVLRNIHFDNKNSDVRSQKTLTNLSFFFGERKRGNFALGRGSLQASRLCSKCKLRNGLECLLK